MSVGLLIISHSRMGDELLDTAQGMLGICPLQTKTLKIPTNCDPDKSRIEARKLMESLNEGSGVLVLTDMYGSTPSNVAHSLAQHGEVNVVAGINLPMLIRILNYSSLNLEELTGKAISGGRDGVVLWTP